MPRYSDASSIVKSFLMVLPEKERVSVTVNSVPCQISSEVSAPYAPSALVWPPVLYPACTPSGCELALKSSGQAFRVPSRRAPPVSGLSPARPPTRLLLRRPTPVL